MALDDPLDEHEQSERVLEWLRTNGLGLVGGLVLGLAAISGWKWWQQDQHNQALGMADQYQTAVTAIVGDDDTSAAKVTALGDTVYANLATLQLAASQVEAGQGDTAIETLSGIQPSDPAVASIVDQRLARLLVDAGRADEALTLLADASSPSALETRGDAQYALGQTDKASEAYSQALVELDVASPQRQILELKLTQVGGVAATRDATGPAAANPALANPEAQS
ncbi:YfgM family protein [Lysobacter sp. A286]